VNPATLPPSLFHEAVKATASQEMAYGRATDVLNRPSCAAPNWVEIKEMQNSWFKVDLGASRLFWPNYYCLMKDTQKDFTMRNWDQEGSLDDVHWETLTHHENDVSIHDNALSVASWPVGAAHLMPADKRNYSHNADVDNFRIRGHSSAPKKEEKKASSDDAHFNASEVTLGGYRYFRLRQWGLNSTGMQGLWQGHYLKCGGWEMYGILFEQDPKAAAVGLGEKVTLNAEQELALDQQHAKLWEQHHLARRVDLD